MVRNNPGCMLYNSRSNSALVSFTEGLLVFDLDLGDKYSVFRELEQPSDRKPVGKHYPVFHCADTAH